MKKLMWCMMLVLLLIDQRNPSSAPTCESESVKVKV